MQSSLKVKAHPNLSQKTLMQRVSQDQAAASSFPSFSDSLRGSSQPDQLAQALLSDKEE